MEFIRHRQNLFSKTIQFPVSEEACPNSTLDEFASPEAKYIVDLEQLHKLCSKGIPDQPGIRPTCWKLLLRYLPADKRQWLSQLEQQRNSYQDFVRDLIESSGHRFPLDDETRSRLATLELSEQKLKEVTLMEQIDMDIKRTLSDHSFFQRPSTTTASSACTSPFPISPTLSPTLNSLSHDSAFSEEMTPWESVSRASNTSLVRDSSAGSLPRPVSSDSDFEKTSTPIILASTRLTSSLSFSPGANISSGKQSCLGESWCLENRESPLTIDKSCIEPPADLHWEALERILFIYAKLNPGVGYVQGMNEILAPIYYVCAHDIDGPLEGKANAEADAFYLFTAVMGSVRDQYVKILDHDARVGVNATLAILEAKLQQVAPDLAQDMRNKGLETAFFAFRWITVLGAQEFDLPDVIRLWDALISHTPLYHGSENGLPASSPGVTSPLNTMVMVGVAMLCLVRPLLLEGTFTDNLKLLQNYPPLYDISTIVELAYHLEALPPNTTLDFQLFISENSEAAAPLPRKPGSIKLPLGFSWGSKNFSPRRLLETSSDIDSVRLTASSFRDQLSRSVNATRAFVNRSTSANEPTSSWLRSQAAKWF
ncbi:hypothetical protein DSO57_1000882 [Entomophthora muscae]|uniref:Uncharacterized protein n=1 Tax=Entomophthora muscae TaxID=34485 RepID=A0ACC2SYH7_9FUNG|nr:hypothetical protein DSO57_1000882 [Entomophthora muscae]